MRANERQEWCVWWWVNAIDVREFSQCWIWTCYRKFNFLSKTKRPCSHYFVITNHLMCTESFCVCWWSAPQISTYARKTQRLKNYKRETFYIINVFGPCLLLEKESWFWIVTLAGDVKDPLLIYSSRIYIQYYSYCTLIYGMFFVRNLLSSLCNVKTGPINYRIHQDAKALNIL
jgi:hypothetical protein